MLLNPTWYSLLFGNLWRTGAIALVILCLGLWFVVSQFGGASAKVEARLGEEQHEAATQSGKDAVETTAQVSKRASQTDQTTLENDRAIRNAEGANAPVTDDLRNAGLRSLCKRRSYSDDPRCVQFAPAE